MKKRDRWKKTGTLMLTAAVLGSVPFFPGTGLLTANAAVSETPLGTYSEEEVAGFQDNILEYSEICGLIEHYNPAYLNQLEIFNGNPDGESGLSREQLLIMAEEFRFELSELKDEAKERKDSISEEAYEEYQENIKTLRKYAKEMEKAAEGTPETKRALREVRNRLEVELSAKYREYRKLVSQDAVQKKTLELAEQAYESALRQKELGMYSTEELVVVEEALNVERAAQSVSSAALNNSRQNLIVAFGWGYDGNPEILPVPEPDTAKIAAFDLTKDMEAAVTASYDVRDLILKPTSDFPSSREKQRQIREKSDQVRMHVEFLYKDMNQKLVSYNTAVEGWNLAESNRLAAERKLQLGLISRAEYLKEEVSCIKAKASREQASMDLVGAMETYEWALKGWMTL